MMGFFVILLAMNMGPKAKSEQEGEPGNAEAAQNQAADFVIGIREAFNSPINLNSTDPKEAHLRKRKLEQMGRNNESGPVGQSQKAQTVRETDHSGLGGVVYFDDQTSELKSDAMDTLETIAQRLVDQKWIVELRGHVSPFESGRSPEKAMALSHERAMQAGRALARLGVPWEQLRVVSCGDSDRVVARSNAHSDDRRNQRVEIIVTKQPVPADAFAKAPPGA
jgi:outer membrane protein OmpA-like peptidoglycan-associated protein